MSPNQNIYQMLTKKNCISKPEGWVLKKTVGSRNLEEILVATGADLAVGIGQADIVEIDFVSTVLINQKVEHYQLKYSLTRM